MRRTVTRPWLLLAAPLAVIAALLLYPIYRVVFLSFHAYGLKEIISGVPRWVGIANYDQVFTGSPGMPADFLWRVVLPNTVVFALVTVVGTVVLGTLVALLLRSLGPVWRSVVIGSMMVAWALPAVTGTYIWVWIFDPDSGVVRQLLQSIGLIGPEGFNWFTERLSFYAIAALNVIHHGYPFVAVTIYAGLLTVPEELYEASALDGAGARQRFTRITLPILRPVFAVVTILSTIWNFKVFTQIYLMPGGDGSNPDVLNLGIWSYLSAFGQTQYGLGSAIAVLLTAVLLVITLIYLRLLFREDDLG